MKTKNLIQSVFILFSSTIHAQDTLFMRNSSLLIGTVYEVSELEIKYKQEHEKNTLQFVIDKYEVEKVKYADGKIDQFNYVEPWYRKKRSSQQDTSTKENKVVQKTESLLKIKQNPSSTQNQTKLTNEHSEIYYLDRTHFFYKGEKKNKTEIESILRVKNDPYINSKLDWEKSAKRLRWIAFLDIPLSIIGFSILNNALENNKTGSEFESAQTLSSAFLIGGAACFTIGIVNSAAYKRNTQKAILYYNKKHR
jgi:hypothetical protein